MAKTKKKKEKKVKEVKAILIELIINEDDSHYYSLQTNNIDNIVEKIGMLETAKYSVIAGKGYKEVEDE